MVECMPIGKKHFMERLMKTVNRYTRAGQNGKVITCPKCSESFPIFHFSWSAIVCIHCKESVEKEKWIIAE